MDELWGIKSVLDSVDDVGLIIIGARDEKVLYCNHIATLKTGLHAGSVLSERWKDYPLLLNQIGDSRNGKVVAARTPFGDNKNVAISHLVWEGGKQAISFVITDHVENQEEKDKELIFKSLGQSYLSMYSLDAANWKITMLLPSEQRDLCFYQQLSFDEWKEKRYFGYIHPEDLENVRGYFSPDFIISKLRENRGRFSFQFRRRFDEEFRWTELRFSIIKELANDNQIICTEKDIQGIMNLNRTGMENELIMQSLSNEYRSVYLLDRMTGEYETVKPDQLLFGIPRNGSYAVLMDIVEEFIPDKGQRRDFREYFSVEALDDAFSSGIDKIGREYNSILSKETSWMTITAFRPPHTQELENKCVITFMDITEHKRVEAERNENNMVIDVLSSRYMAVFFAKLEDETYHSIKIPKRYVYIEKQVKNFREALQQYTSIYVLEEYRDLFRKLISSKNLLLEDASATKNGITENATKQEYLYRNIDNRWIRLNLFKVPVENAEDEVIIAFEDYDDIMNQNSLSMLYNATMLSDYDGMYEYDPEQDIVYTLVYDGEKLNRNSFSEPGMGFQSFNATHKVHPDDEEIFRTACAFETIKSCVDGGKTVSHLYIRRWMGDAYHMFMYGFHYFEELGHYRVLIMVRDADKEIV